MPPGRERTLLAVLALVSGLSWWAAHQREPQGPTAGAAGHRPDYWAEGLRVVAMAPSGAPDRRLVADEMRHYPADDTSELDQPRLVVQSKDGIQWNIRAERGRVGPEGKWVLLEGAVRVQRGASPGVEPMELRSEALRVQPEAEYVETDQPVRLDSGASWVEAVGMEAWVGGPSRIKLLSQVRGHYVQN